jgi:hypothetical protein
LSRGEFEDHTKDNKEIHIKAAPESKGHPAHIKAAPEGKGHPALVV